MKVAGLQKLSLIDYPDHISAIIFVWGCNFRCPFCHNPELVKKDLQPRLYSQPEVFNFLKKRKGLLEAVTITGGEPLLYSEFPEFIKKIKNLGYLVKVDTNGTKPGLLKKIIDLKLVDYIAMDIKAPLEKYEEVVKAKVDLEKIKNSVKLIIDSGLDYEFRSTVVPDLHSEKDIENMAKLVKGAKMYFLQNFTNLGKLLDPKYKAKKGYSKKKLESLQKMCEKYVLSCGARS